MVTIETLTFREWGYTEEDDRWKWKVGHFFHSISDGTSLDVHFQRPIIK